MLSLAGRPKLVEMQPSCSWLCFHATQIPLALEAETPKRDGAPSCSATGKESSNAASDPASTSLCLLPAEKVARSLPGDQTRQNMTIDEGTE